MAPTDDLNVLIKYIRTTLFFRIAVAVGCPLFLLTGIFIFRNYGSPFFCPVYELTGFYCPGCGSTRALADLFNFDLCSAAGHNIFFVIALPGVGYYLLKMYLLIITGKDILPFPEISLKTAGIISFLILLYAVIRNIPVHPFTILAPRYVFPAYRHDAYKRDVYKKSGRSRK